MTSLNPVYKIGKQVGEGLRLHRGYSKQEALKRATELLDLVGNQNIGIAGKSHSDHDTLTHTAGELVRILIDALLGLGNTNEVQKLRGTLERLLLGATTVQTKALAHLLADLIDRVQGCLLYTS